MISKLKKLIRTAPLLKHLTLIAHSGNKYTCPFCNYSAKDLFEIGSDVPILNEKEVIGGGKRYAGCYKCDSDDRERLIYVYLKEKFDLFRKEKSMKILHIAPERNLSKKLLDCGFREYICGDLFTPGYRYPVHVQNINILDIPFTENHFDLIICNHVLEHIPDDLTAMKELVRVLKRRGQAILQVPISKSAITTFEDFSVTGPKERELAFGQCDHVRIYGQDYINRLASCGFEVKKINISGEFSKFGLNVDEEIVIGTK
jgi:SAM-dependent methyltransferase